METQSNVFADKIKEILLAAYIRLNQSMYCDSSYPTDAERIELIASLPNEVDISSLKHCHDILEKCIRNTEISLKDDPLLNLPGILETVDFLFNQKEIQEQLALLPKEETLDPNTKCTAFTQEKFARLLFLCREISPKSHTIFEQNQSKIQVTTSLLTSLVLSPISDKLFEWCAQRWISDNPTQQFPTEIFESLLKKSIVNETTRWSQMHNNYISHRNLPSEEMGVFLSGVLPLMGLEIIASLPCNELDASLLEDYNKALEYLRCSIYLKDKKSLNLPDMLNAIAFLLNQKEIQEQLNVLPKEETLGYNAKYTTFTQEKFAQLLFLCREVSPEGRTIFEQNKHKIHITISLLNSMIVSPCSDELFQWCANKWTTENSTQEFPKEPLKNALIHYTNAIHNGNDSASAEIIRTITEATKAFESRLKRIVTVNKSIRWEKPSNNHFYYRNLVAEKRVFLLHVLPSAGLQAMESLCPGVFDVSFLAYYHKALDYCKQNSTASQDKNILNLPDILDAIDFLLNQKEIQEQLVLLPKEETLDPSTKGTTFTQENFAQLLFLCHEIGPEQGRKIFEQYQSKIEVTTSLLTSMIVSPCSDELFQWCAEKWTVANPTQQLPKEVQKNALKHYIETIDRLNWSPVLGPEKAQATTNAFEHSLKRIVTLNKNTRWEKPDNPVYFRDQSSEQSFLFMFGILPLTGLQIMAALPNSEFDVSLLEHYCIALSSLNGWMQNNRVLEGTKIFNLEDILGAVNLLLNRPEIQKQLTTLLKEGTFEYYQAGNPAFTQEKFSQLLLLCRETHSEQGHAIFDQYASNIQVNAALLTSVVSWPSDAPFQWCAEKWISENPKQELLKELMQGVFNQYFLNQPTVYLISRTEAEPKIAIESFRNILNRIVVFNKNIKLEKYCSSIVHIILRADKAVFLSGVLPLEALTIMESVCPDIFDASLLTPYYKALEYCREKSDIFKDKEILNLPDILNAISFLLNKKELQEQLMKLPTDKSVALNDGAEIDFTQEKLAQLLFLYRELTPEQGSVIFEQHESKIQVTVSLLVSLASWASNAPFEKCIQQFKGNLPEGIVGGLAKKYTLELEQLRYLPNCSADEKNKKVQEATASFELSLSRIFAISKQKPIICGEQDFSDRGISLVSNHGEDGSYLCGILPVEAIRLMKEQFNIQLNPVLFVSYLTKLGSLEDMIENEEDQQFRKIVNYSVLLEAIRFLMQSVDAEQIVNALKTTGDLYIGLSGMSVLQAPEFYEPIYKKLCLSLQKKTATVQEYEVAAMLKKANKHKNLALIALLSTHPHASISPDFLKISSEMNYYEGLACILKHRPEFLEKLSISNKMLTHSPEFEAIFQQRLKNEAEKHEKSETESHEISEKALRETFDALSAMPDIYIPDMVPTIVQIVRSKRLLKYSTQEVIDLEFGSFLSVWNKKGIPHPDLLAVGKSGESLLGSLYGYKPELYTYLLKKLSSILPSHSQNRPLDMHHKRFCFKLAVLFPNTEEVDAYFKQLTSKIDKDNAVWNIIAEASNFNIPTQGYWDIEAWFSFVKRNQFGSRPMAFLGAASDMDMKMALGDTIFSILRIAVPPEQSWGESILKYLMTETYQKNKDTYDKQAKKSELWNLVKKDLWENLAKQCPSAYESLIQQYSKKQRTREEIQSSLAQQKDRFALLLKNVLETYDLYNPTVTLTSVAALRLRDFLELPREYQETVVTALEHGYSNKDIKELITFLTKNKQAFTFVPAVIVDGTEIDDGTGTNYNGYQLKPLEKTDPMALVAGLKTRCCQHFNNAGAESAMHAYSSIYGTTYRLASKKDPNTGDWFAQSWVVLSECGTILLFDSIEFAAHAKEKMVLAFFKKAAEKLLVSNPHLQEIWVGASEHARFKLEKHGYARKPADENFSIAGYSKDSYTDSENIVVLLNRNELKIKSEEVQQTQALTSVVIHPTQKETKVNAEYQLRHGVDTYLKPGKVIKLLGLSEEARRIFNESYASVIALLKEDPENPILEEGFVSSDPDNQKNRYREGECYITYQATKQWLDNTLNPKIKERSLAHQVYAAKEEDVPALLQKAQQNTSIKTFTVVAFIGIHAVSVFVDPKNSVCFILDSEPGSNLTQLIQACKSLAPNMRVITPEADLRLQKDFYSCATFALKSARYFAKNAAAFSMLLMGNQTDILATVDMPPALLKMAQTPLTLTEEQNQAVVSKKKNLTLLQYNAALKLTIGDTTFNTAALKTRQNWLKQIHQTMKIG